MAVGKGRRKFCLLFNIFIHNIYKQITSKFGLSESWMRSIRWQKHLLFVTTIEEFHWARQFWVIRPVCSMSNAMYLTFPLIALTDICANVLRVVQWNSFQHHESDLNSLCANIFLFQFHKWATCTRDAIFFKVFTIRHFRKIKCRSLSFMHFD